MTHAKLLTRLAVIALGLSLTVGGYAQQTHHTSKVAAKPVARNVAPAFKRGLEPHAVDILKQACARLAAARSMSFTAVVSYESPSRLGPPLVYSTRSEVTMQRPDKLKVVTLGDGPPSDFY
jgi:hypothetical protein